MLFMVADQLPAAWRATLALSCKSLFASLCPTGQLPELDIDDRCTVLLILEKEAPNWYLCFGCVRFRPTEGCLQRQLHPECSYAFTNASAGRPSWVRRRNRCARTLDTRPGLDDWRQSKGFVIWKPLSKGLSDNVPEITFTDAHLVMNRHFYGAAYGLPTQHLKSSFEMEKYITIYRPYGWRGPMINYSSEPPGERYDLRTPKWPITPRWTISRRTSAKIIDDELFICRRHRVTSPPCSMNHFIMVVDNLGLPVCRHIFASSFLSNWWYNLTCIPELLALRIASDEPSYDVHPDEGTRSCHNCFTDYEISIKRGGENKAWGLELVTYHKLGGCRLPQDTVWCGLVTAVHRADFDSVPGGVRSLWLRGPANAANSSGARVLRSALKTSERPGEEAASKAGVRANLRPDWADPLRIMIEDRYGAIKGKGKDGERRFAKVSHACLRGYPKHVEWYWT